MADELSFPEVPMYCQICGARIPTGPRSQPDDDSLLSDVPPIELGLIPTKEENT
jgi:hypothetical protein